MTNFNLNQAQLSERLLLLQKLDLEYSNHKATQHRPNRETKLLNTIALLLSTGRPGDHFAAAFDKRQGLEVILAKNGTPTSEDIADAKELFSCLCNPEISNPRDLYPFVSRRCRASVLKRIQKLRASIVDTGFYNEFYSRLDQYPSARDLLSPDVIEQEFPEDEDAIEDEFVGMPLSVVLRDLLEGTIGVTSVSEVPNLDEFVDIHTLASTLGDSSFMQEWIIMREVGYQKAKRFQQCRQKLSRYIDDVHSLIRGAKRLGGVIKYRWVTDESLGIQAREEDIRIHAATPEEAAHRASVLSSQQLEELKERKPSLVEPWQRTVHSCIHAEIRIILHFGRVSMQGMSGRFQPIGLSKSSCLCCVLWIAAHNIRGGIWWQTRSRNKPDPTWAFTARACPNVQGLALATFDEKVISGVLRWLQLRYESGTEFRKDLYQIVEDDGALNADDLAVVVAAALTSTRKGDGKAIVYSVLGQ
ncbi:hypothetical protein AGABI1DRAFT_93975 [Agaricus bisporus var. burnettii JB137-S8]|uniref:Uncharacterized protein n=1 Tax=Agaricus bisporus var. burnettii (strain JB137-S8 / ATCC MYA-4627 / FGSC 10392) TaxID=597362 RepID=K5VPZ3_AGABU|nr:uncharacterized protein AGABI1DRAFT_93975 [Agaricus bisporus var. burnettii JB137-S8]EKM76549.1 hypothetical protein AGABI1DRAFT_93975 [Agaricus bisporus var. burnettii JB137-S8]